MLRVCVCVCVDLSWKIKIRQKNENIFVWWWRFVMKVPKNLENISSNSEIIRKMWVMRSMHAFLFGETTKWCYIPMDWHFWWCGIFLVKIKASRGVIYHLHYLELSIILACQIQKQQLQPLEYLQQQLQMKECCTSHFLLIEFLVSSFLITIFEFVIFFFHSTRSLEMFNLLPTCDRIKKILPSNRSCSLIYKKNYKVKGKWVLSCTISSQRRLIIMGSMTSRCGSGSSSN